MTYPRPRIVVADDSAFMRRLLVHALEEGGFDVVGVAEDGEQALELCAGLAPDALSLDLAMPGTNGLDVLSRLRSEHSPIPVVVVSAFSPAFGARAIDALAEGAFELVAKPAAGATIGEFVADLCDKMGAATRARRPVGPALVRPSRDTVSTRAGLRTVLIACSTGGPRALGELLPKLPAPLGRGCLVVQHMPAGFTRSLADRLDAASALSVREAAGGETLGPEDAIVAPGGRHLRVGPGGRLSLSDDLPVEGLRPRADLTIADAAAVYGDRLVLAVLTGMGKDGLAGARAVKEAGGRVLAEAESTCVVYGMPRAVVEAGLADDVVPLQELHAAIAEEARA